ncbi:hypothetical protein [Wolbachia endosymbiont of Cantharis cryptica]|uniref:hypothetical protein n=1 Tax=Wolbachia endosymbiont of Cantharis cryptica TaxID=3066132 RepID=UPI00376EC46E
MIAIIYLAMLGIALIIGSIVSILIGLALSTLTSLSPLMIGGIVGTISVVPLIATFIKTPLSEFADCNDYRISGLILKEIACLTGLFIGSVAVGVGLGSVVPIVKVDSLSSLSTTMNSLIAIGFAAPVLPIVAAIGAAIALDKIKKLIRPPEKEPSRLTKEELQNLLNELREVRILEQAARRLTLPRKSREEVKPFLL